MFICKRLSWLLFTGLAIVGCKVPKLTEQNANIALPKTYDTLQDSLSSANLKWQQFFTDPYLVRLIDTAIRNNQELQITLQEIEIARNEARIKNSQIFPSVGVKVGVGLEKVGRYTSQGAGDASTDMTEGKPVPDPLADFGIMANANWEVDIWKKLHDAKKAALSRYLATIEGRNFVLTNLIAEVANTYYELLALDSQLGIVRENVKIQTDALRVVKAQKDAGRTNELAVKKFNAEVLKTSSMEFDIRQQIVETENRLNLLLGRYPKTIERNRADFTGLSPLAVKNGIPSQLLANRPDIQQAEQELKAAKLDVKVARAEFYPSLGISAGLGLQAFKPSYLFTLPESMLYAIAGDLATPIINRGAIKAEFANANARQIQALYNYERTVLNAYLEVANRLSSISNLEKAYDLKSQQVNVLSQSIEISNDLFRSAHADYFEVLMTQRDALEAKLELIETKKNQLMATVNVYKALGGGWK
ncbi:RND efflux system, outer membrane lipoprotein, NodT family [Pseudopedobacter saltans DSM 12145]|uniref:RND efflux system, outer membrane lipoprotein, NodT family n=1 Tax=Pseudopedobacter saltans (strain ATCC 51119 / DSM 12145 / JCM 21818 / CCUG 39354 / LMG 10337 / NBRC 100064 / NCIMB 13643) TaxID=762903 RepID=F0SDK3_PSESL|nr:TolC family protein [Pseudopedobacter saltans]ADY50730.1 RND efflux system, outer membrane lipoprotein, NodT family [Pseudopedobacter saltans DSM 12145]